jgi:conjugal transfer/entry exclusion protein
MIFATAAAAAQPIAIKFSAGNLDLMLSRRSSSNAAATTTAAIYMAESSERRKFRTAAYSLGQLKFNLQ